jgi:predicted  nucleic acid-binding Zn-ribbon protein
MDEQLKQYIEDHERDVKEIRKQIEEAREKLRSNSWNNPLIKELFEGAILVQESQLQMSIENHKIILEFSGMGV